MTNYSDLKLYLVNEGEVTPANPTAEWDGVNSILVAATNENAALKVADAYDAGRITAGNLAWNGETIAVVMLRDRDTGIFV